MQIGSMKKDDRKSNARNGKTERSETAGFSHFFNLCLLFSFLVSVTRNQSQYAILNDISIPKMHLEEKGLSREALLAMYRCSL